MKKKIAITIRSLLIVLIIGMGGFAFYLYNLLKETATKMHVAIKTEDQPDINKNAQPISILLMGVDERAGDKGRSDTLIAMTLNPKKQTLQMISIPRDTRTEIIGKGTINKINAAYAYGGPQMAMDTVANFSGVKMDYFIRINMDALSSLVDAVGGVTVQNELDWTESNFHYAKGQLTLNGKQALGYVRMRHQDPRGDFGRNDRQRQVIMAIVKKAASFSTVTHYNQILEALGNNVTTNLSFNQMMAIQKNYRECRNSVIQYEVEGTGKMIDGIYYLLVSNEEKLKVTNMLKNNLEG